jgi:hypothetical protein
MRVEEEGMVFVSRAVVLKVEHRVMITGKRPETHPFAAQLNAFDSPKPVSDLL